MIWLKRFGIVFGLAGVLVGAQPSSAATLTATVRGTVVGQSGTGSAFNIGVFGNEFSLLGQAFSATYTFETDDAPFRSSSTGVFSPITTLAGGPWSPNPSAQYGRAALTIAGLTVAFDGRSFGSFGAGIGERTLNVMDASEPGKFFSAATNLYDPSLLFPSTVEGGGAFDGPFTSGAGSPSDFFINYGDGRLAAEGSTQRRYRCSSPRFRNPPAGP